MANKKIKKPEVDINYKGQAYNLVFNLNVMEQIQEEYGTVTAWGDLTDKAAEPNAKAVIFGITCMINEGIDIYNEDHEDDDDFKPRKYFTHKQVGRIVSEMGLDEAAGKLNKSVIDSTKSDEKN